MKIEVPIASPLYEGLESKVIFLLGTGFDQKLLKPFFNKDSVISFCTTEVAEVSEKNNNIGIQSDNFIGFFVHRSRVGNHKFDGSLFQAVGRTRMRRLTDSHAKETRKEIKGKQLWNLLCGKSAQVDTRPRLTQGMLPVAGKKCHRYVRQPQITGIFIGVKRKYTTLQAKQRWYAMPIAKTSWAKPQVKHYTPKDSQR